jgi:hypothetical protein
MKHLKKHLKDFFEFGNIVPATLITTTLITILGVTMMNTFTKNEEPLADMRIDPASGVVVQGEIFQVKIVVDSTVPVNVFAGQINFNPAIMTIKSIDYNTSIADLWAELPWYSNGEGTLTFAGGTTKPGGFFGTGDLITINFITKQTGVDNLTFENVHILQHDGLGTEATTKNPIDALFTVQEKIEATVVSNTSTVDTSVLSIVKKRPPTDLNGDGKQSVTDMSMFMADLLTNNLRSDFNLDGKVNTKDLSIIMQAQ